MSVRTKAKRWTYLLHRWLGIGGCLLMLLWFVSGMVMLFIGYPKLTPWERLAALPALGDGTAWQGLQALPPVLQAAPETVALTTLRGQPAYVVRAGPNVGAWSARSGAPLPAPTGAMAADAAGRFAHGPVTAAPRQIDEDRWTHARSLNAHRPLYRVAVGGAEPGNLYVSSRTGEVVLDAPRLQQRWNYVGAWLHWLYMLRSQPVDPVWTWTVIALSGLCTLAAISGVLVGIWRWRFRGRYRAGAKTPYSEPWMRWHHLIGLGFSAIVCSWIFSGLMSMNPAGVFSSRGQAVDIARYQGTPPALDSPLAIPAPVLAAVNQAGFAAVELQWRRIDGALLALAWNARGDSRVVRSEGGQLMAAPALPVAMLEQAGATLVAAPQVAHRVLHAADAYYYQREPEAMNGASPRRLPAVQLDFADAEATRVYIDQASGDPVLILGQRERVGRWLFYFLHSWDLPVMLAAATLRRVLLILLSLGGAALCTTACVIGWRRLRSKLHPRKRVQRKGAGG